MFCINYRHWGRIRLEKLVDFFYVHVTVRRNKFLYNKTS